jgi:hypothetical protein
MKIWYVGTMKSDYVFFFDGTEEEFGEVLRNKFGQSQYEILTYNEIEPVSGEFIEVPNIR